ncbi:MAG: hypothetical protein KBS75_00120 [Bacteroidales bacterium]|nr:hypothetical protein [Candidatus Equimonas faecalis]
MKTTGIVCVTLGILAILGSFIHGNGLMGGFFFTALGAYLIHRANEKNNH